MEIIQLCPQCGFPAIPVGSKAVVYNLTNAAKTTIETNVKWSICNNPNCDCAYFSKTQKFKTSDLIKPLFFKNKGYHVPICYCSDLTRGEITNAVKQWMRTIDEVQEFTQKNITGFCEERNPLGKCCRNVFLRTIADSTKAE